MPRDIHRMGDRRVLAPILLTSSLLLASTQALAQQLAQGFPAVDGMVNASTRVGNTLYIGGAFEHVGGATGGLVAVDRTTAALTAPFPAVAGYVNDIESDGAGGWFLGGEFSGVNGEPRANLAHVLADGTLTPWNPGTDSEVLSLLFDGEKVYVAGSFTTLGGAPRAYCGAIDATTGVPTAFAPVVDNLVYDFELAAGRLAIIGGFDQVGSTTQPGFAMVDTTSGAWAAGLDLSGYVESIVRSGDVLFLGGNFTIGVGPDRVNLAAVDASSCSLLPWSPVVPDPISRLQVGNGTLYLAGTFSALDGEPRAGLGAYDVASGLLLPWAPAVPGNVYEFFVTSDRVYLQDFCHHPSSGNLTSLVVVDLSGTVLDWEAGTYDWVGDVVEDGSRVWLAGNFGNVGGAVRHNLAAIDLATNALLPWQPSVDNSVFTLAALGSTLYVGGEFTQVQGTARSNLAAVDLVSGALQPWDPSPNYNVYSLAAVPGHVYAGGQFWNIGGRDIHALADLDPISGLASEWAPDPNGLVSSLLVTTDRIYAAGDFDHVGNTPRAFVSAFDRATGDLLGWDAQLDAYVTALAEVPGGIAIGGGFSTARGAARQYLAVLSSSTAELQPWSSPPNAPVTALCREAGALYVAGAFTSIGGKPRHYLAALDPVHGTATDWDVIGQTFVTSLQVWNGSLVVCGAFRATSQYPAGSLARIDDPLPTPTLLEIFRASAGPDGVTLEWKAATRSGLSPLAPQRSASAGQWEPLAGVAEAAGDLTRWLDRDVTAGEQLEYRLTGTAADGSPWTSANLSVRVPTGTTRFSLGLPAPHPIRDAATVSFGLPVRARVKLSLLDVQGRQVALLTDAELSPGEHVARLTLDGLRSGLYFLRLQAPGADLRQRLVVTR